METERSAGSRRFRLALTVGCGVFVLAVVGAVSIGSVTVPFSEVVASLGHHLTYAIADGFARLGIRDVPYLTATADSTTDMIVWQLRAPRTIAAIIVGAALAVTGAALQAMVRNPLADPYVLGVSSGASLAAALVMSSATASWMHSARVPFAAFVGAMITLGVVLAFAQRQGTFTGARIVLAGVAVGQVASAATTLVQLHSAPAELRGMLFWMVGSVAGVDAFSKIWIPVVVAVVCIALILTRGRGLNAMSMGDDDAIALGVNVHAFRLMIIVLVAVLTGVSVAMAGGVGFVGLMIPHAARFLVGADYRRLMPVAALLGAGFLVFVDTVARSVDPPNEYPLTIFTAACGGPFFLWLLRRSRTGGAV